MQPNELWWNNTLYEKYGSYRTKEEAREISRQLKRKGFSTMIKLSNEYGATKYAVYRG